LNLPLVFSGLSLALVLAAFFYLRSYVKRRTDGEVILDKYREEINGMIADINRCTERDSVVVEERVKKLKALIESADKKLATLLKEEQAQPLPIRGKVQKPKQQLNIEVLNEPLEPAALPLDQQIADLYHAGADPALIADKLGISVAEVNLATAMLEKK
jgi:hypothetical protein